MEQRKILILVGAGASTKLGAKDDLPLMREWAAILRSDVDRREPGLADALGLYEDADGEKFEEAVGKLYSLKKSMRDVEEFLFLGNPVPGHPENTVDGWRARMTSRLEAFDTALNETLYDSFAANVISRDKVKRAYSALLDPLDLDDSLVIATTNYDLAAEIAVGEYYDREARDGFPQVRYRSPELDPEGLVDWAMVSDAGVPVLHLHGAVGWYLREDGTIARELADRRYNPTLGVPAILPPDPNKDPMNDATVQAIWQEFTKAVQEASHILVLGHSLHDRPIERAFKHPDVKAVFARTYHRNPPASEPDSPFGRAIQLKVEFGPDIKFGQALRKWLMADPAP
jgi:hypothetical protein